MPKATTTQSPNVSTAIDDVVPRETEHDLQENLPAGSMLVRRDITCGELLAMVNNDYDIATQIACALGRLSLLEELLNESPRDLQISSSGMFANACKGGNTWIVFMLIGMGVDDWNLGLKFACMNDQTGIMRLMLDRGATRCYNCDKPLEEHRQLRPDVSTRSQPAE